MSGTKHIDHDSFFLLKGHRAHVAHVEPPDLAGNACMQQMQICKTIDCGQNVAKTIGHFIFQSTVSYQ